MTVDTIIRHRGFDVFSLVGGGMRVGKIVAVDFDQHRVRRCTRYVSCPTVWRFIRSQNLLKVATAGSQ